LIFFETKLIFFKKKKEIFFDKLRHFWIFTILIQYLFYFFETNINIYLISLKQNLIFYNFESIFENFKYLFDKNLNVNFMNLRQFQGYFTCLYNIFLIFRDKLEMFILYF